MSLGVREPGPVGSVADDTPTGRIDLSIVEQSLRTGRVERGTKSSSAASNAVVKPVGVTAAPIDHEQALADRHALIQLCLYAMDRARSGGVAERIEQGLTGVGVHAMRPDGQRFDPSLHEAGGAVVTGDATLAGTVAETEVVGFVDHDRLLRAPIVTVYTRR